MRTGISRLEGGLRSRTGRVNLIPCIVAGYPDKAASIELGRRLASAGAAAIEIEIPFSDPLADGPTIQRASHVALSAGMTVAGALEVAAAIAQEGVPVVVMSYFNPLLAYGGEQFGRDAAACGVAGVLVVDLPTHEAGPTAGYFRSAGLDTIFLIAPTSTRERISSICAASSGFIYCVTLTGVTGARGTLPEGVNDLLARAREQTDLPLAAGFGISKPDHIRALSGSADAAIVSSALIQEIDQGRDPVRLLADLVAACP
ncbi:MAG TPA: tryptophan synthase subunit alpha [Candidatus Dormibacteraeota bacterium]|jgi:tryptophan synthase alpha chain|nr:tryptophan synthase subunit alpha [Candidatus Dormibacteraeota bacterium]